MHGPYYYDKALPICISTLYLKYQIMKQLPAKQPIHKVLKSVYGYDSFRPMQEEIINTVISGRDTLVIMPTGGGKSMCFQIPSLVLPHLTVVVSPLIALMKDQVQALQAYGVDARSLNSHTSNGEQNEIEDLAYEGKLKMLYVSPERLNTASFQQFLGRVKLSLFAIDESHCVSMWGNDFRKDYLSVAKVRDSFPTVPFVALTATADAATQDDICDRLHLKDPARFVSSFERKNITTRCVPGLKRMQLIYKFLDGAPNESGIIYCLSKKSTQKLAEKLRDQGYKAAFYHAGMSADDRNTVQEAFLNDDLQIICATIAFGMGIDKSNIRWVIHYNLPKNIESYYQEIGRAGRDGVSAKALLFYSFYDLEVYKKFITEGQGSDQFKEVQTQKLNRVWEYATSPDCRTNLVLNYFGEFRNQPCGHCDNCLNPPKSFDGTKETQIALSAVVRANQEIAQNLLIDVIRGSGRREILDRGLDKIKTYGIGRQQSTLVWKSFITQMINQGYLKIDYTQGSSLKLTPLSLPVLKEGQKVRLVQPTFGEKKERNSKSAYSDTDQRPRRPIAEDLADKIRKWRREKARSMSLPPYIIFADSTLKELASEQPTNFEDLERISGIGKHKLEKYGQDIINVILAYQGEDTLKSKGMNYEETYDLYQKGHNPETIALKRDLNVVTIYSHLAHLYLKGKPIDLRKYISKEEFMRVKEAMEITNERQKAKVLYDHMNSDMPYYKIRIAIAMIEKESKD